MPGFDTWIGIQMGRTTCATIIDVIPNATAQGLWQHELIV